MSYKRRVPTIIRKGGTVKGRLDVARLFVNDVDISGTVAEDALYIGPRDTEGSWRLHIDGDSLRVERHNGAAYEDQGSFVPAPVIP